MLKSLLELFPLLILISLSFLYLKRVWSEKTKNYLTFCFVTALLFSSRGVNLNFYNIFPEHFFSGLISFETILILFCALFLCIKLFLSKEKIFYSMQDLFMVISFFIIFNFIPYINYVTNLDAAFLNDKFLLKILLITCILLLLDNFIKKIFQKKYENLVEDNMNLLRSVKYFYPVLFGVIFLEMSYQYVGFMGQLATKLSVGPAISDQLLNILPYYNTSIFHVGVFDFFRDITFIGLIFFVRYLPFALFSSCLLIILRSSIVWITNLGKPALQPIIDSPYTFGGDLFFSGHVAIPFLLALVFWNRKYIRIFFFISSFFFGISALVGRFHYSIDVISAPFFAYGIFNISKHLFPEYFSYTQESVE